MALTSNQSALLVPPPATNAGTGSATNADIRDIKGLVPVPSGWAWLGWALVFLVAAVAGVLTARYWLKRRSRPRAPEIIVPPHVRARDRLREALALIHQPEPFCTRVSFTLRVYLEERFHLHAPERTTEEFLDELQRSPVLALAQKQSLGDFLVRCDLVKFARDEPGERALRDLWDAAVRLVEETAQPEVSPTQPAAAGKPPTPPPAAAAQAEHRTSNVEHPTSNSALRTQP